METFSLVNFIKFVGDIISILPKWSFKSKAATDSNRFSIPVLHNRASLVAQSVKNFLQCRRPGFYPWVGKIPWRRAGQPTPGFLPGESPWTEEPGRLRSMGSKRVTHDWATKCTFPWQQNQIILNNKIKNTIMIINTKDLNKLLAY